MNGTLYRLKHPAPKRRNFKNTIDNIWLVDSFFPQSVLIQATAWLSSINSVTLTSKACAIASSAGIETL